MPARRRVADPHVARQLAQRELPRPVLAQRRLGALEQGAPQVAVVVGAGEAGHGTATIAKVDVDSIVFSDYIELMTTSHKWDTTDLPRLDGRTYVVTGANSGIGLTAARELARAGGRVVLAVRDRGRGEEAAATIPGDSEVRELDLADLASVRAFADAWDEGLDVLVNNAGVMAIPEARTRDGFEMQIGTNHLGHFALTNLLLPRITDRVVTVSSGAHRMGRVRLDDLNWEREDYSPWPAYGQSKLANLLFTLELQRRLAATGSAVRALAAHPGYSATNLQGRTGNAVQHAGMAVLNRIIAQSDEMGALPTLFAATQDLPGASYVGPDGLGEQRGHPTLVGRTAAASDLATAEALWELSERLTGVAFPLGVAAA
jgi:NAD(P)-dependent dehydrogenase (short-subunit alcohol dehydrogenase family)